MNLEIGKWYYCRNIQNGKRYFSGYDFNNLPVFLHENDIRSIGYDKNGKYIKNSEFDLVEEVKETTIIKSWLIYYRHNGKIMIDFHKLEYEAIKSKEYFIKENKFIRMLCIEERF